MEKLEERFMSHLTIARLKYVKDKKGFTEYVEGIGVKEIKFKVNNFKVNQSKLIRKSRINCEFNLNMR